MRAIMKRRMAALAVAALLGTSLAHMEAQETGTVALDPDDIGGVVTSAQGPEAEVGTRPSRVAAGLSGPEPTRGFRTRRPPY